MVTTRVSHLHQLLLTVVLCAFLVPSARAATVTSTADSGAGSLRQAIVDTPPYGKIDFDPSLNGSTIVLSSQLEINATTLTIQGPGPDQLAISGNRACRVFWIDVTASATLAGLTIRDGNTSDKEYRSGGGILAYGHLAMRDCIVRNCQSTFGGGGIYVRGDSGSRELPYRDEALTHFIMDNCRITSNATLVESSNYGGGVSADLVAIALRDCTFDNNQVLSTKGEGFLYAGGLHVSGTGTLERCEIRDNALGYLVPWSMGGIGGAGVLVVSSTAGPLVFRNCRIAGNALNGTEPEVEYYGSAIRAQGTGYPTIFENTIIEDHNTSGPLIRSTGSTITLRNCTIANNVARNRYLLNISNFFSEADSEAQGTGILTHCTIASNTAQQGDLVSVWGTTLTLGGTVIYGNTVGTSHSIFGSQFDGAYVSRGYNCIESIDGPLLSGPGDMVGVDPMLGPLTDNGGPTRTMRPLPGSPLIDAIPFHPALAETDQRGVPRPAGIGSDIGACEAVDNITCLYPRQSITIDTDEPCWTGVWDYATNAWAATLDTNASAALGFPIVPGEWTGLSLYHYGTSSWVASEYVFREAAD